MPGAVAATSYAVSWHVFGGGGWNDWNTGGGNAASPALCPTDVEHHQVHGAVRDVRCQGGNEWTTQSCGRNGLGSTKPGVAAQPHNGITFSQGGNGFGNGVFAGSSYWVPTAPFDGFQDNNLPADYPINTVTEQRL